MMLSVRLWIGTRIVNLGKAILSQCARITPCERALKEVAAARKKYSKLGAAEPDQLKQAVYNAVYLVCDELMAKILSGGSR